MKKKKILILGSEGQIGGNLVEFYEKQAGYEVIKFDIILGKIFDLRNYNNKNLEKNIAKSDFIYFLAFDVGGSRYLKKYQKTYNFLVNNLLIMTNVFKLIKKHKKKFLFASSQMSNMDFSPYGTLKRLGEDVTKSLKGLYVKFWNVYGVEKELEKSHVITDFVLMALKNKKIKMLTSGTESREFLFADDCSLGMHTIMKKYDFLANQKNELHLTTSKKIKIIEIAKIIKKILKEKSINISIHPSKKIDSVQNNISNKSNNYLNKYWKPKTQIEVGIRKILEFYNTNKNL